MKAESIGRFMAARWKLIALAFTVCIGSLFVLPIVLHSMSEESPEEVPQILSDSSSSRSPSVEKLLDDTRMSDGWIAESEERRKEFIKQLAEQKKRIKRQRRIEKFRWESPAETRGRIWNVPNDEAEDALLTALLRVCIAEGDGDPRDCTGIWQVVKNNRQRTCRRGVVRRITECDENGETYLSALRRHQRHVLGKMKARNKRAVWIRNLTPDCDMPDGYINYIRRRGKRVTRSFAENHWDARYGSKTCPQTVADARRLISGKLPESRPGVQVGWLPGRPVTWGGRCEEKAGSCDDRIACERVLARIPNTETLNAFWCRISNRGCRSTPEPLCEKLGYRYKRVAYKGRTVWKLDTRNPLQGAPEEPAEPATTLTKAPSSAEENPGT